MRQERENFEAGKVIGEIISFLASRFSSEASAFGQVRTRHRQLETSSGGLLTIQTNAATMQV